MIDHENVIKGLEQFRADFKPFCGNRSDWARVDDAIALLKEQEAEIKRLKRPDCEHAEHDCLGCLGYSGCKQDDEPIEACQLCEQYTGNRDEIGGTQSNGRD